MDKIYFRINLSLHAGFSRVKVLILRKHNYFEWIRFHLEIALLAMIWK
uniref:Uncharacterized protein n=1 Tax=Candidatus Kentrum sp. TC TaxID=2126339 RepID=A0A450Y836_9GAMM|nr:MAG: hypothetical protein BECKTC1821D_GA0114238_100223 [Candidatus Kentron sp. TC]VFK40860.1 MAG: hypothetical protein BECKTC1821E_GA0114239_100820 [Candidatus Kentron sp. TC]VFK53702.1 MAG: hypothetical protein BECKTC1821F_GA0114240_100320 [Candidatus Kentron sp. TC]